jgi:hypothetical protein
MVEQAAFQTVFQFLQTVGILVGVFYYVMTIRANQRNQELQLETRQAQLFMQIYDKFNDYDRSEISIEVLSFEWENNEDFWSKYSFEADPEAYRKWNHVAGFFEGVGVLVKRKLIDPEVVDDLMSASTLMFWERYGPVIIDGRKRLNMPQMWEWAEYLYHEIKSIANLPHTLFLSSP